MRIYRIDIALILMWAGFGSMMAGLLNLGDMALEFVSIGTFLFGCGVILERESEPAPTGSECRKEIEKAVAAVIEKARKGS